VHFFANDAKIIFSFSLDRFLATKEKKKRKKVPVSCGDRKARMSAGLHDQPSTNSRSRLRGLPRGKDEI
jgi:hypothetical protein